jgi:hypothetical protein
MKIIVSMDAGGEIWAHHEEGDRREVCFFKTEEETEEELRAWGYPQPWLSPPRDPQKAYSGPSTYLKRSNASGRSVKPRPGRSGACTVPSGRISNGSLNSSHIIGM